MLECCYGNILDKILWKFDFYWKYVERKNPKSWALIGLRCKIYICFLQQRGGGGGGNNGKEKSRGLPGQVSPRFQTISRDDLIGILLLHYIHTVATQCTTLSFTYSFTLTFALADYTLAVPYTCIPFSLPSRPHLLTCCTHTQPVLFIPTSCSHHLNFSVQT